MFLQKNNEQRIVIYRVRFINLILMVMLSAVLSFCSRTVLQNVSSTDILKQNITEIFDDPNFYVANWGVYIESLETGEIIFKQNPYHARPCKTAIFYQPLMINKLPRKL